MVRRGLTWLLVLPAIVVGSQLAHGIAYWWAYPQASLRMTALATSGHGYLAYLPVAIGFLAAVQIIAFAAVVVDKARGLPVRAVPAWAFLFIPEVGFILQEHVERFATSGVFPWWTVVEPSFWRGLVLQVPIGIAAYLVASILLRTATAIAGVVAARRPARVAQIAARPRIPMRVVLPRLSPLAQLAAGRAPPRFA